MAPVQLEPQISYSSVALLAGHVLAAIILTVGVGRSLYRSYRALGPAQDTRERQAQRSTLIPVFATLALISLGAATYASLQHAILSYKTWATQLDVKLPVRFYGYNGVLPLDDNATRVYLGLWASDTPFFLDALEILAERARRFWWGQQVEMGLISWNLFLAIEGHRRNIPLLWCYSSLAQLVSLSYAQNLFFLAMLLTPSPLPPKDTGGLPVSRYVRIRDAIFPPKPNTWTPHQLLYLFTLTLAWGTTHSRPHEAYRAYTLLFQMASLASFTLHAKATFNGLAHSAPEAYFHRHSLHYPFDVERRSAWERTTSAFGRILAATADHPVVGGAGFEVLLSAASLGLWAAVRATSFEDIAACAVPGFPDSNAENESSQSGTNDYDQADESDESDGAHETPKPSPTKRKRGRPAKRKEAEADAAYKPAPSVAATVAEGDVIPEEGEFDWESTALVWGLTILGGLGAGSAGVLGGECIAQ
ncbi:hypothetical protein ACO1O0_000880 [Amphichorda felina]